MWLIRRKILSYHVSDLRQKTVNIRLRIANIRKRWKWYIRFFQELQWKLRKIKSSLKSGLMIHALIFAWESLPKGKFTAKATPIFWQIDQSHLNVIFIRMKLSKMKYKICQKTFSRSGACESVYLSFVFEVIKSDFSLWKWLKSLS